MNLASAFVTGARLIRRPPDERLRESVGCFWALPCTADTHIRSLPDGCATLSIELCDGRPPHSFITGPRLAPGEWSPACDLTLVGVRLRPGVLFAVTRIPAWRSQDAARGWTGGAQPMPPCSNEDWPQPRRTTNASTCWRPSFACAWPRPRSTSGSSVP